MGLATFVATHLSHIITLGFSNKCMAPKSKRHNNPLIPTLNLSKITFRLNLATFIFAINPFCTSNYALPFHNPPQMSQFFTIEIVYFGDVLWLLFLQSLFILRWVFVPNSLLTPLWATCNLCCAPNTYSHCELQDLQCSYLLMHGIVLHTFCNLHHFLTTRMHFSSLKNGIVSPMM